MTYNATHARDRWIQIRFSYLALTAPRSLWEQGWSYRSLERINKAASPCAAALLELMRYWTQSRSQEGDTECWLTESLGTLQSALYGIATSFNTIRKAIALLEDLGYLVVQRFRDKPFKFRLVAQRLSDDIERLFQAEQVGGSFFSGGDSDLNPQSSPEVFNSEQVAFNSEGGAFNSEYIYKSLDNSEKNLSLLAEVSFDEEKRLARGGVDEGDQAEEAQSVVASEPGEEGAPPPERSLRFSEDEVAYLNPGMGRFMERWQKPELPEYVKSVRGQLVFDDRLKNFLVATDRSGYYHLKINGQVAKKPDGTAMTDIALLNNNLLRLYSNSREVLDASWEQAKAVSEGQVVLSEAPVSRSGKSAAPGRVNRPARESQLSEIAADFAARRATQPNRPFRPRYAGLR
jgi:hypothetical protein